MISTTPSKIRVRDTIQNLARKGHRTGRRGIINLKGDHHIQYPVLSIYAKILSHSHRYINQSSYTRKPVDVRKKMQSCGKKVSLNKIFSHLPENLVATDSIK
ncbi:PREDICTED: uncharacterized protein LOC108558919 isoform X1 [Nicrophorus vespilloides]|uniref:Uncharacterized protein LOC108558919 isoform X1 n=1 Tax=Nicrophorus vespilloides TaxID=110193 RepID=A0ABM1MA72_NICVS|nr:PREDICTED: uncharacterized protein LOC108558919 isoform X1 [Nicrophorus vespilloides]